MITANGGRALPRILAACVLLGSIFSLGLISGSVAAATTTYQAENATISQGVVESNHTGFTGTGFVNYNSVAGSYVQFTVNAATASSATLIFRYANGTTANRPMEIRVNGVVVGTLPFPPTANWDTWATQSLNATLSSGANSIRATATTADGGPNLDRLDVDISTPVTVVQAESCTLSQAVVATNHTGFTGTGFVDYDNVTGSFVECRVDMAAASSATLIFRYANGTTANRPMSISVNGTVVNGSLAFNPTANWDTWATQSVNAALVAGSNSIRATATTAGGGPNLDRLDVNGGTPPTATPTATPTVTPTQPPTGFRHPGILVSREQLNFIKSKVAAGAQPWKAAYDRARNDGVGSLNYTPHPWQTVECGSFSNPNFGCSDEQRDVRAAYTHALLWYINGNSAHAKKAIEIMNAWARTLTGGHINSNGPLQAAWAAEVWPRAAEIIRYTYTGWSSTDIARFENMLKTQYLPSFIDGAPCNNGNWELSMVEAMINVGVFLNDKTTFDKGISMWRLRTPAYIYLKTDGATPVQPPGCPMSDEELIAYWHNQRTFVDGLSQETCRDYGHLTGGFAAMINAAETARIQGIDLYGEQATRITKGFEFHAQYLNGVSVPSWLCGGTLDRSTNDTWEIGYNHYHNRLGLSLPQTLKVIQRIRPVGANHHMVWESLTHAEVGSVGIR